MEIRVYQINFRADPSSIYELITYDVVISINVGCDDEIIRCVHDELGSKAVYYGMIAEEKDERT